MCSKYKTSDSEVRLDEQCSSLDQWKNPVPSTEDFAFVLFNAGHLVIFK